MKERLNIQDALKLTDIDSIDNQINIRQELIASMVGNLYPSILSEEIYELLERKSKIITNQLEKC